ncbi:MAG: alanine--tRNA ligase-related protein [Candidatus Magasanikbacteria bacterium]
MKSNKLRKKFLRYFEEKNHTVVPSSKLRSDDSSVLLTTAGMQQFKEYFTGDLNPEEVDHPSLDCKIGKRATSVQKCFRTSDIEEVGDSTHLTFFEMLGNFSFGAYFKQKAITLAHEFVTSKLGLDIAYVTVFDPEKVNENSWLSQVPFDEKSYNVWKNEKGLSPSKIKRMGKDNFWGPTGQKGPCGPTTEIFVEDKNGNPVEIWNLVFNQFFSHPDNSLEELDQYGVDTGMGLERVAMITQGTETIFETDLFEKPFGELLSSENKESARIISDHIRGASFLLAEGIEPSNKKEGYVLRRIIRRLLVHKRKTSLSEEDVLDYLKQAIDFYGSFYNELLDSEKAILEGFKKEMENFQLTIKKGLKEFDKEYPYEGSGTIEGKKAFNLYQSYGLPLEIMKELAKERGYEVDEKGFQKALEEHKEKSRDSKGKKGGHGLSLDTGELTAEDEQERQKVVRLHTATHLLQQALRDVLGNHVKQMGSNINAERTRFDFYSERKLTEEELNRVEKIVNEKIKESYPVRSKEMPKSEAENTKALSFFKAKYPEKVTIYYIGPEDKEIEGAYSAEFCAGPHVENTSEIGDFEIIKQESVGRETKRIRATVHKDE